MSRTRTVNESFTRTSARHVSSKVAADLERIRIGYGSPTVAEIDAYEGELVELLAAGYVQTVTYGYKRNGEWIVPTLKYETRIDGSLITDDRAGKIQRGADVSRASFTSYLSYSPAWWALTQAQRYAFKAKLPIQRTSGAEPTASGVWAVDKSYSHNGGGVNRSALRPTG